MDAMTPVAALPRRSVALVALEIGQSVLFGVLLALATASAAREDGPVAVGGAALTGVLFAAGLVFHRSVGALGRGVWVVVLLAAVHLLSLRSPAFVWLAFPVWLFLSQLVPLPAALALAAVSVTLVIQTLGAASTASVLGPLVGALVALGVARGVTHLEAEAQRSRALLAQVVASQAEAARLSDAVAAAQREAGVHAERARLAHDIHDTLAQGFSSIVLLARAGLRDEDPPGRAEALRRIEATASANLAQSRSVVHALAPDPLASSGLAAPLWRLADDLAAQTGATVAVDIDPDLPRLSTTTEVALLRAAQGALGNVRSHASASHVTITLGVAGDEVRLDVVDDGRGFDPATLDARTTLAGGYGLRALRERLAVLGGGVDIESEPGSGTAVSLHLPLSNGGAR